MKKNFYCNICQTLRIGVVMSVDKIQTTDATKIKCDYCLCIGTLYEPADKQNEIITIQQLLSSKTPPKEKIVGEGDE
jgi:hypothetical protein